MACLRLKRTITFLMSVFSLLSLKAGLSATCRPICSGRNCITVHQARVDFKSAEETCRDRDGELMTFQHKTDENTIDILTQGLNGNFWIGLRLPAGACSNLSDPFRGYVWTSGDANSSFIPSFTTWKRSVQVCSSHCVSISSNRRWTESMCSDKTDGFLCRTEHKDACRAQRFSDPTIFQSPEGCSNYPCEHDCTDTKGGYKCSCHPGYIPDKKDPKRCQLHCGKKKCPAKCEKNTDICYCPAGFILNNQFCEDIDECLMKECDQGCKNTFGSFECSCQKGFVLKSHGKCVKAKLTDNSVITTPTIESSVKPTFNNNTLKVSSAPAVRFLWIWIIVAVTIIVLIITVRFYVVKRQRLREQPSNQQSTAVGNL